jgi:uncharacterized protein YjdB
MKTTKKERNNRTFKRVLITTLSICFLIGIFNISVLAADWNNGDKNVFVPYQLQQTYNSSNWMQSTNSQLNIVWYENPTENANRWEAFVLPLRIIEARNLRMGAYLSAGNSINFSDSNELSYSAKQEASKMVALGVLTGYEDNTIRPKDTIKRGEFSKIVTMYNDKSLRKAGIRSSIEFTDTQDHWAKNFISYAYQCGFVNGLGNSTFKPDSDMTKEELVQIMYNCIGCYSITSEDVQRAVKETFNVVANDNYENNYNNNNGYTINNNNNNNYGVTPTNIYISRNSIRTVMRVGNVQNVSYQLTPTNAVDNGVSYYSSNTNVLRVNNSGRIEAINYGTATITVRTSNNKRDSITIDVNNGDYSNNNNTNNEVLPTSIIVENVNSTMRVGDTQNIIYKLYPSNAVDKGVSYYSSNTNVVMIDNDGRMTAKGYGTATITVSTLNGIRNAININVENNNYNDNTNTNTNTTYNPLTPPRTNIYVEGYEPQEYYNAFVNESFSVVVENVSSLNSSDILLSNSNVQIVDSVQSLGSNKYRFRVRCTSQTDSSTVLTVKGLSLEIRIYK